jgi:hypothetical protein
MMPKLMSTLLSASALLLAASCSATPGTQAMFGEELYSQKVEFHKIFNQKSKLADVVVTTRDYREAKDQQEWCSILDFEDGKYVKFEYQKNRKYQYGTDRRKHIAGFAWPLDYYDDPENRCILLLEVSSEFAIQGDNLSYQGSGYAEELQDLRVKVFMVRRTKDGFAKDEAKDPEILKAYDLISRAALQKEESTAEDDTQMSYLMFSAALALLRLSKEIDAAVDLQKIISRIEAAAAAQGSSEAPSRCDLMNLDYLKVACKRLIEDIKQGKYTSKDGKDEKQGGR